MSTQTVPVFISDRIHNLPEDLAESVVLARQRLDAMEEEEESEDGGDDKEEEDEDSKMSFADRMKAAKAKAAKKDSEDVEAIFDRIDALEAENEILASLVPQDIHEDADDEEEEEEYMSPQEIALQLISEFEKAKPFLPLEASVADYGDVYDIYEDAIGTRFPGFLLTDEEMQDDDDRLDPNDADELRGAFKLLRRMANPMQQTPEMAMDSKDADRAFSEALGMRSDSLTPVMPCSPVLKPLY